MANLFYKSKDEIRRVIDRAIDHLGYPRTIQLEIIKLPNSISLFTKTLLNHFVKLRDSDDLGESEEVEGFFFLDNGDIYKGNWVKNQRVGRGICIFADGSLYQGEWNHDLPDGYGLLKTKRGDCFEGDFLKGQL